MMPKCYFPRLITNPNYDDRVTESQAPMMLVPCGKCHACLSARRRQWLFRLKVESQHSTRVDFITLTYENDPITLEKNTLVNFARRCKYTFGNTVKYYGIGEYGTHTKRPHYHILIFHNALTQDVNLIPIYRKLWSYGNIVVASANMKRMNYITHYHIRPKRVTLPDGRFDNTFCIMSKGIGLQFLTLENINILETRPKKDVSDFEGKMQTIPRYYRKKVGLDAPEPYFDTKSFLQIAKERGEDPFALLLSLRDLDTRKMTKYDNQEKF